MKRAREKEEKKEIRILRVVDEKPFKELKVVREEKEHEMKAFAIESFLAPQFSETAPSALLEREAPVQNLEDDLALIPRTTISESQDVKSHIQYGASGVGYGALGYGEVHYESNQQYQTEMGQNFNPLEGKDHAMTFVHNEAESIQKTTRSSQDRLMDYQGGVQHEEKKERKMMRG